MSLRLIIAATSAELGPLEARLEDAHDLHLGFGGAVRGCVHGVPLVLATLGVGKVNTAAGVALAIAALQPAAVVQIGIGGAFPHSELTVGKAVVASEEVHLDSGVVSATGFDDMEVLGFPLLATPVNIYNRIPVDQDLSSALAGENYSQVPFGTCETVTGDPRKIPELARRFGVAIESMEGAAAAQVSLAMGVPFAEVRGVSNEVGERDKSNWRIEAALEAAHHALGEWLLRPASIGSG